MRQARAESPPEAHWSIACDAPDCGWIKPNRVACRACRERRGNPGAPPPSVRRVANQRMIDGGKVHADLVRASGFERAAHQRRDAEALDHADVRAGRLSRSDDRHRRALCGMASDGRVDRGGALHVAAHDREVVALHRARLQLPHERGLRLRASSRPPAARSCPCRAGARCPRAAAPRAPGA